MKKLIYILFGLLLCLAGCLHDETTGAHLDISEISTTFEDSLLYATMAKDFELDAKDFIKQTQLDTPLEYTWSVGSIRSWNNTQKFWELDDSLSVVSNEAHLKYRFKMEKKHLLRLKVVNQYTAHIQYFVVDVTPNYSEGPIVFSKDEQGNGMFSFLDSPKGVDSLFTKTSADFRYVTGADEPVLNEDIVDFVFYSGNQKYPDFGNQYLYVLSKKNKKAYAIDHHTLYAIPEAEYAFSKTPLNITLHWHSDKKDGQHDLFAFTEDGDVLSYCCKYRREMVPTVFDTVAGWDRYGVGGRRSSGDSKQLADILWLYNDKTSTIYGMRAHDTQKSNSPSEIKRKNDYIGPCSFPGEEIVNAYYGRSKRLGMMAPLSNDLYIVTRAKEDPSKVYLNIWEMVGYGQNFITISNKPQRRMEMKVPAGDELALKKDSRVLILPERDGKIFHNGKKVFCMTGEVFPPLASVQAGREVFDISKISPNAEIMDICLFVRNEQNNAQKHYVFVATYDSTSVEGKKGSVYVLAADDFTNIVAKYENVAYKPLNIFYKNRL